MIILGKQIFPGEMVSADAFIPRDNVSKVALLAIAISAVFIAVKTGLTAAAGIGVCVSMLLTGWAMQRHYSRSARGGFFLDKPRAIRKPKPVVNFNTELTEHFRSLNLLLGEKLVTEALSLQYRVIKVPNVSPAKVAKELDNIAILSNIDEREIIFQKVYDRKVSAYLIPAPMKDWKKVSFNDSVIEEGKLLEHVGNDIKGNAVIADRQVEPMALIFGSPNSGKTEAVRASIFCLMKSSLKPRLFIADLKPDMGDLESACEGYTKDRYKCLAMMKAIYKEGIERQARYNGLGLKNFWEFEKKFPGIDQPILLYIDELPKILVKSPDEVKEKDEMEFHLQAQAVLSQILSELRAAGVFVTASLQTPKADIINTNLRDKFGDRRAFNVPDDNASRVGLGWNGAEKLQKFGGMLYYSSMRLSPLLCRSVLIS